MEQEVAEALESEFGFAPERAWLGACLAHLGSAVPGFVSKPHQARLQLVLEQLLAADLRVAGSGGLLPPDVAQLHKQPLEGRFLLQVDEVVNIAASWKDRWVSRAGAACGALAWDCMVDEGGPCAFDLFLQTALAATLHPQTLTAHPRRAAVAGTTPHAPATAA
jgi:hypothetical protein